MTGMNKADAIDKVLEEFEFEDKVNTIFRAFFLQVGVFGLSDIETVNGFLNKLADEGLSNETINDALERWTDLVFGEDAGNDKFR